MKAIGVDALRTASVDAAGQRAAVIGDAVRGAGVLEQHLTVVRGLDLVGPAAGLDDGAGTGSFYRIIAAAEIDREADDRAVDRVVAGGEIHFLPGLCGRSFEDDSVVARVRLQYLRARELGIITLDFVVLEGDGGADLSEIQGIATPAPVDLFQSA